MRSTLVLVLAMSCARAPAALTLQPAATEPAVGLRSITGADPIGSKPLLVVLFYPPAVSKPDLTEVGPYRVEASPEVPIADGQYPLVVISHGHAGSRFGHHDLAEHLARSGFIVAAVEHAGDSWNDQTAFGTDRAMYGRAYQASAAIDAVLADTLIGPHVDPARIGVTGFSAGGYTALTLVGASPDFALRGPYCERHPGDEEICKTPKLEKVLGDLKPMRDTRVKAAFVMAPLGIFFRPAALEAVTTPVFLAWADHDPVLLPDENAERVQHGLKTVSGTHIVQGAGHYVFLAPCTAELASEAARLCEDPVGVDRLAVHRALNAEAATFFRASLEP